MKALWEDTRYLFYTLFHPFNGFYELRFHRRKNWVLIGLLYLLYGVVQILKTYYSGMLVGADPYGTNNLVGVRHFPCSRFCFFRSPIGA